MTDEQRALALAAIDPGSAIKIGHIDLVVTPEQKAIYAPIKEERALTFAVEVESPPPHKRWRFFLFWLLVRLAARVYPFKFEIYRTPKPWERDADV